ncbi:LOW QUALITY PROTEIN: MTOR-associated protein MEAK7-like [Anableps anableps]
MFLEAAGGSAEAAAGSPSRCAGAFTVSPTTRKNQGSHASMGALAPDSMVRRVCRCLCSIDPGQAAPGKAGRAAAAPGVDREQLVVFLADVLRGTAEERAPLVMVMSHDAAGLPEAVSCEQVAAFLEDLIAAVVQISTSRGRLQGWRPEQMGDTALGVKLLAEQMCSELRPSDQGTCDVSCVEDWVFRVSQVSLYLEILVAEGLGVSLSCRTPPPLLPPCGDTPWKGLKVLLDVPTLMFLAPQLPDGCGAPWRLVFSTHLHGESFTKMASGLLRHGPTLLLIRDTRGHVFGGFASQAWELKPQFQGDSRCFLFSVFPTLRVYTATGYNEHFMYLNQHQQTMPNGLGMGGQHDYFGLWLDCDFGGHSRARPKCTTYGSPQLSGDEDFALVVEVWAVGKPPAGRDRCLRSRVEKLQELLEEQSCFCSSLEASWGQMNPAVLLSPQLSLLLHSSSERLTVCLVFQEEEEEGKKSILNVDPEVQAMMELTGKTLHSEGFNELEEDFD